MQAYGIFIQVILQAFNNGDLITNNAAIPPENTYAVILSQRKKISQNIR